MNNKFNLFVYSDDPNFCSALALECNKYGFELVFFEVANIKNIFDDNSNFISVVIIDLDNGTADKKMRLGESARISSNFPVFGVINKITKNIQQRSKDYGFDLIITKRMLLKSIKKVVVHISTQ